MKGTMNTERTSFRRWAAAVQQVNERQERVVSAWSLTLACWDGAERHLEHGRWWGISPPPDGRHSCFWHGVRLTTAHLVTTDLRLPEHKTNTETLVFGSKSSENFLGFSIPAVNSFFVQIKCKQSYFLGQILQNVNIPNNSNKWGCDHWTHATIGANVASFG